MSGASAPLTVLGSYRIERQLGRGGMGTVRGEPRYQAIIRRVKLSN